MPNQFLFQLPETFDPGEFLPRYLARRHDDARYLVSTIVKRMLQKRIDFQGCVNLNLDTLRNIMASHDCVDVIRELIDHGAIERYPYKRNVHSYAYRLAPRFMGNDLVSVAPTDARLIARINAWREPHEAEQAERMTPLHEKLREMQTHLTIETEAYEILAATPKPKKYTKAEHAAILTNQRWMIDSIRNKVWTFSVGETKRVFNNLTNLKKTLRPYVRLDGKPLVGTDFSCFQPALAAWLWKDSHNERAEGREGFGRVSGLGSSGLGSSGLDQLHTFYGGQEVFTIENQDFHDKYIELCQTGKFNHYMAEQLASRGVTLKNSKKSALVDIFAKKGSYASTIADLFKELFPEVWKFIRSYNARDPAALICDLQRMESSFMIGVVATDLLERFPGVRLLTLHDAIYTATVDVPKVRSAFGAGCDRIEFPMTWKVES